MSQRYMIYRVCEGGDLRARETSSFDLQSFSDYRKAIYEDRDGVTDIGYFAFAIEEAESPENAIRLVEDEKIDLVVCDPEDVRGIREVPEEPQQYANESALKVTKLLDNTDLPDPGFKVTPGIEL